jgi:hypothetical protein
MTPKKNVSEDTLEFREEKNLDVTFSDSYGNSKK